MLRPIIARQILSLAYNPPPHVVLWRAVFEFLRTRWGHKWKRDLQGRWQ